MMTGARIKLLFSLTLLLLFHDLAFAMYSGQTDVSQDKTPFLVSIRVKDPKTSELQFLCGGAILNKNTVVSAGHCADAINQEIYIYGGDVRLSRQYLLAKVAYSILHPSFEVFRAQVTFGDDEKIFYDFAAYNDIAVFKTDLIEFIPGKVSSIELPAEVFPKQAKMLGQFYGWGMINKEQDTDILKSSGTMNVVSFANQQEVYDANYRERFLAVHYTGRTYNLMEFYFKSTDLLFFSDNADIVACSGDSGSPVFTEVNNQPILIGLISATMDYRCGGHTSNSSLITNVSEFVPWLQQMMLE